MVQITGYERKWKEVSQTASVYKTLSSCKHKTTLKYVGRVHKTDTTHTMYVQIVYFHAYISLDKDTWWSQYHQRSWRVQCHVRPL